MDLIEQLGGYDVVKAKYQTLSDSDVITIGPFSVPAKPFLEAELLEYRREHNIYELRDKIVFIDEFMHDEVMTVSDGNNVALWMDNDTKHAVIEMVRHATDAEIKAMTRGAD